MNRQKITTYKVENIFTGRILRHQWYWYFGKTEQCKGSTAQEALASEQADFYKVLMADYSQQFAQQSAILATLKKTWEPILEKGPGQYGYTDSEDAALRTMSKEGVARGYQGAAKAVNENIAAIGGGNEFLPSGAADEMKQQVATTAAGQEATQELGITQSGFERGYQEFLASSNALSGNATTYNPTSYAGSANTAGENAFNSATTLYSQGSPWGAIGGILGGGASAFLGGYGQAVGKNA